MYGTISSIVTSTLKLVSLRVRLACYMSLTGTVERTKHRPMAAGHITITGALLFLAVHISILFGILWRSDRLASVPGGFIPALTVHTASQMAHWHRYDLSFSWNVSLYETFYAVAASLAGLGCPCFRYARLDSSDVL